MSLYIASLNSGSNGNCYYIGNETEAVLVDAGISCKEIEKRMKRLSLDIRKVKAVFISHEHSDHISGLRVLAKKYHLPVYITPSTARFGRIKIEKELLMTFSSHQPVTLGTLTVTAFPKFHDAADPYSFVISSENLKVGVFTDIGVPCENVVHHFRQCHAAFLETNYDETMLEKGSYPFVLKKRISSDRGHLSNKQALELFLSHRPAFMSHLFLSHLSQNNNSPELVRDLFDKHANGVKMVIASRNEESEVFHICDANANTSSGIRVTPQQLAFVFA